MFTTVIQTGRLYEHRILSIESLQELEALGARAREVMGAHGGKVVVCADYRHLRVMKPEYASMWVEKIKGVSPNVERSAILIPPGQATFGLQVERMVKDAGAQMRRAFRDAEEMAEWLGEVLTPAERTRLTAFLKEAPSA